MDLLGDSDAEEEEKGPVEINTDNSYATSYDTWRQKEHIQKLKDKYGENYEEEDEEESDESSDDSEAEELDDEMEKDFFSTLASLKKKDPKIYDGETVFFKERATEVAEKEKVPNEKKVTLKDLETHVMLKKGGHFDEIEDKALKYGKDMSYNEEMKSIKDSFKNALNPEDDEEEEVLEKKVKSTVETQKEEVEYKSWLAGQKSSISDHEIEDKMSGLRDFWNKENLDEGEKFLKDFLLNKRFLDKEDAGEDDDGDAYDNVAHDSDDGLSEDEANVEKMEEFEHKFNFRFEEPDEDFIKRYPRTIKGTMRKEEDKRSKKRKEVEERKKREKQQKKEEIKMLKNAKKKEIMAKLEKLKKITGNDDMELNDDDIEGDFDPEKYDAKMKEVFDNYDDAGGADLEKPTFSDLEDEDYDEDYEAEDWDNWTGAGNADEEGTGGEGAEHCEDEDFNMDCDYDANLAMQKDIVESTKGRKKGRRKSKFAEALESSQPKPAFDPKDEKTFEEYVEEYYKLDCEDIIDDVHCRFQYRSVPVNNFGLTTEEILASEDRELNAWASLRKTCMYRREEEEKKDFHVYKNRAKDERLKKKLLPTLYKEEVEEAKIEDVGEKTEDTKLSTGKKKRKLVTPGVGDGASLKRSKLGESDSSISSTLDVNPSGDAPVVSVSQNQGEETNPKKKKKKKSKKNKGGSQGAAIQTNGMASLFAKTTQNSSSKAGSSSHKASKSFKDQMVIKSKQKKPDDGVGLSNERLKAYGVNPNKFKRDKRKEIFKKGVKEKD